MLKGGMLGIRTVQFRKTIQKRPGSGKHLEADSSKRKRRSLFFGSLGWGEGKKKGTALRPTVPPAKTIGGDPSGALCARGGQEPEVPVLGTSRLPRNWDPRGPTEHRMQGMLVYWHVSSLHPQSTPLSVVESRGLLRSLTSWTAQRKQTPQSYLNATAVALTRACASTRGYSHERPISTAVPDEICLFSLFFMLVILYEMSARRRMGFGGGPGPSGDLPPLTSNLNAGL
ncbi:hypothetical protein QBC43DRAFT_336508 [Cladorrhinum sp. PSN259]|nr:hypothetical protein QBC43DRAFT_336508 [Cladorrhinum sp. PSN259]